MKVAITFLLDSDEEFYVIARTLRVSDPYLYADVIRKVITAAIKNIDIDALKRAFPSVCSIEEVHEEIVGGWSFNSY